MSREDRQHWTGRHAAAGSDPGKPVSFVVENAELLAPGRTLDVACGRGRHSRFLAARGHRIVAVDVALPGLRETRVGAPGALAVLMDLDEPGFRSGAFDNVVCTSFLDRRLFPEFHRWLRPGGRLLVDTFLIDQREIGHPRRPELLLGHNELLSLVAGWRVLRYREGPVREDGTLAYRAGVVAVRSG